MVIALIAVALPALAEDDSRDNLGQEIKNSRMEFKAKAEAERKDSREEMKENREEFRKEAKDMRMASATPAEIKAKREAMVAENKKILEERKKTIEEARKKFQADLKAKIEQFKADRKKISDEKKEEVKKKIADGIIAKLDKELTRIDTLDQNLTKRIVDKKARGLDTTSAEGLQATAKTKLEEAKLAVASAKESISTQLASTSGVSKEALKETLKAAQQKIVDARKAYRLAIEALPKEPSTASTTQTTN